MNQAQVLDAWRVDRQRQERENDQARVAAREWVASRPELCDENGAPCPFAIDAVLHYRRLGGRTSADVIRRHRDLMVAQKLERLGNA